MKVTHISSRDNPLVQRLRKLTQTPAAYRKLGQLWLEGDHLCRAYLARCGAGAVMETVVSQSLWDSGAQADWLAALPRVAVMTDAVFASVSSLESSSGLGCVVAVLEAGSIDAHAATVVLDRVQDAGNVGSILRSAAAFGLGQVLALQGTAALWSPKVVRAGMGAHFGLRLIEGLQPEALGSLQVPLLATSSHAPDTLGARALPWPCAWVLGHEGQGVADEVLSRCAHTLRIAQPGGEESLNVAAAAAVCFYESRRA